MESKTKTSKTTSTKSRTKAVKENTVVEVSTESSAMVNSTVDKPAVTKKVNPLSPIKTDTIKVQRNRPYRVSILENAKYAVVKNEGGGDLIIEDGVRRVLYCGDTEKINKEVTVSSFSYPTISITYWG
jgi:hypothetical protein